MTSLYVKVGSSYDANTGMPCVSLVPRLLTLAAALWWMFWKFWDSWDVVYPLLYYTLKPILIRIAGLCRKHGTTMVGRWLIVMKLEIFFRFMLRLSFCIYMCCIFAIKKEIEQRQLSTWTQTKPVQSKIKRERKNTKSSTQQRIANTSPKSSVPLRYNIIIPTTSYPTASQYHEFKGNWELKLATEMPLHKTLWEDSLRPY